MIRYLTIFICVIFIYGCSSDDDPQNDPFALSLDSVGDQFAVSDGLAVDISLSANNPNRVGLIYAATAVSGGSGNIDIRDTTFDTVDGVFSWSMAGVASGSYLIKFTVSEVEDDTETDSELVKIVVQDRADQYSTGVTLYTNDCQTAGCHGPGGLSVAVEIPDIQCVIQTTFDAKLGAGGSMEQHTSNWNNNTDIGDVFFYLQHVEPENCP